MKSFRVVWEIDIEAESALEAVRDARRTQLNTDSDAVVFRVTDENGEVEDIDLLGDEG